MVECELPKLERRVRFPSPAPKYLLGDPSGNFYILRTRKTKYIIKNTFPREFSHLAVEFSFGMLYNVFDVICALFSARYFGRSFMQKTVFPCLAVLCLIAASLTFSLPQRIPTIFYLSVGLYALAVGIITGCFRRKNRRKEYSLPRRRVFDGGILI